MTLPLPPQIPANDLLLRFAENLGTLPFIGMFLVINYVVVAALCRVSLGSLELLRKDIYYHVVFVLLIPLGYGFLIPDAYLALRDGIAAVATFLPPHTQLIDDVNLALRTFHESYWVTASAAVLACLVVVVWVYVLRLASVNVAYWWYRKGQITLPGYFFLAMCALVTWSGLLFVVNAAYSEFQFVRIIHVLSGDSRVPDLATTQESLNTVQRLFEWMLYVWSLPALGVALLGLARRRAGLVGKFDYLLIVNALAMLAVAIVLVVIPMFRLHDVLIQQRQALYNDPNTLRMAAAYPIWPADITTLVAFVPTLFSAVMGLDAAMRRVFRKAPSAPTRTDDVP
jgi:hypothetical protein